MRDDVIYLLVGYDPDTDHIAYREAIPESARDKIVSMVDPDPDDKDAISSYQINIHMARDIMSLARLRSGEDRLEYFLESRGPSLPIFQHVAASIR